MRRWIRVPNGLALIAGCLMVAALLLPWWSISIQHVGETDIYPYSVSGPASELVGYRRSPQMTILSYLLGMSVALCFIGSIISGAVGRVILGTAGVVVLLGTWRFLHRLARVASRFDIPLEGTGTATYMGFSPVNVEAEIRAGTYVIVLAATLCLVAAALHRKLKLGSD